MGLRVRKLLLVIWCGLKTIGTATTAGSPGGRGTNRGRGRRMLWRLLCTEPVANVNGACEGAAGPRAGIFPPRAAASHAPGKTSLFPAGRADLGGEGGC